MSMSTVFLLDSAGNVWSTSEHERNRGSVCGSVNTHVSTRVRRHCAKEALTFQVPDMFVRQKRRVGKGPGGTYVPGQLIAYERGTEAVPTPARSQHKDRPQTRTASSAQVGNIPSHPTHANFVPGAPNFSLTASTHPGTALSANAMFSSFHFSKSHPDGCDVESFRSLRCSHTGSPRK